MAALKQQLSVMFPNLLQDVLDTVRQQHKGNEPMYEPFDGFVMLDYASHPSCSPTSNSPTNQCILCHWSKVLFSQTLHADLFASGTCLIHLGNSKKKEENFSFFLLAENAAELPPVRRHFPTTNPNRGRVANAGSGSAHTDHAPDI